MSEPVSKQTREPVDDLTWLAGLKAKEDSIPGGFYDISGQPQSTWFVDGMCDLSDDELQPGVSRGRAELLARICRAFAIQYERKWPVVYHPVKGWYVVQTYQMDRTAGLERPSPVEAVIAADAWLTTREKGE